MTTMAELLARQLARMKGTAEEALPPLGSAAGAPPAKLTMADIARRTLERNGHDGAKLMAGPDISFLNMPQNQYHRDLMLGLNDVPEGSLTDYGPGMDKMADYMDEFDLGELFNKGRTLRDQLASFKGQGMDHAAIGKQFSLTPDVVAHAMKRLKLQALLAAGAGGGAMFGGMQDESSY